MARLPHIYRTSQTPRPARRSLRVSLQAWLLGVALLPLITLGMIGYSKVRDVRQQETRHTLITLVELERERVQDHFRRAGRELNHQSRLAANRDLLRKLRRSRRQSGMTAQAWAGSSRRQTVVHEAGQELLHFQQTSPWRDIMMLDASGVVLYSCRRDDDLGANILTGHYSRSNLADAVRAAADQKKMVMSNFAAYEASGGAPAAFLVVPMNGLDGGDELGFMAFLIGSEGLTAASTHGVGRPGPVATYVVDEYLRVLTRPPAAAGVAEVPRSLPTELPDLGRDRDFVVRDAFEGAIPNDRPGDGPMTFRGPTGESFFGHNVAVTVYGQRLGVICVIRAEDAMDGLPQIRSAMVTMIVFTALLVALVGHIILRRLVQPIVALSRIMMRMADGHDVDDLQVIGHNEVGDLADQFAVMIGRLNEAKLSRDHQYELQQSQFELNVRMRGELDSKTLATAILEFIADYYGAQVGAFYLAKPGKRLVLAAQLGEGDEQWPLRELHEGQGLVGRAAMRRRIEVLHGLPADHLQIQTSLGQSPPRSLIVAPFHLAGQVKGVMELGTANDVTEDALEFLQMSAESIAVTLDSARSRQRVNRLLDETRRQAEALARQQKELRETNEQLARSDRYKNEFLANMSHELRTPLNSMMLMSQVLAENRRQALNADEVEAATTINAAGKDLLTIINDILDLSKVEAGKLELSPHHVDLTELVADLRLLFQPVADGQDLAFRTRVGPSVPDTVFTDGLRLNQILKNLLNNACKFTEKGSVELTVRMPSPAEWPGRQGLSSERWVALAVTDTGIGMSADVLAQVFESFNQGDGSIGRRFGGSGLGLSISQRLTTLLQGHLEVASVEGQGTTITLYLPLTAVFTSAEAAQPAVNTEEPPPPPINENPQSLPDLDFLVDRKVVLADDDMRTIYGLSADLERLGLATKAVRTMPELLDVAVTLNSPSLVVVNPGCGEAANANGDGNQDLQPLRAAVDTAQTAIIALVGANDTREVGGADAVLSKPVDLAELLQTCHDVLLPEGAVT